MTDIDTPQDPEVDDQLEDEPVAPEEEHDVDPEVRRLRDEAARRRIDAREATERADRLSTALTVTAACTGVLTDPADFARFHDGPVPTDDDGLPDHDAIRAAAEAIVTGHPHLGDRRPRGRGPAPTTTTSTWRASSGGVPDV